MDAAKRASDGAAPSSEDWVRSVVRRAIAIRLFPTGKVNWLAVDAAILTVEAAFFDRAAINPVVVRVVLDSDHNAIAAERSLLAAGTQVTRDPEHRLYQSDLRGVRLIVQPAADSNGIWERDL
ncbi:hypothetical protein [Tenggerimyces flavus]|uniref:Uncharacterized protein n=1 Tax=Tenggerimyces flavus TaxID=1708749 RepID=A0ABV7YSE4_9ACTN|nr:hypothetical protein [Tenggerimyces flavus]MBM7790126.1 hypothetical protein [Tenggerimyces flavus]